MKADAGMDRLCINGGNCEDGTNQAVSQSTPIFTAIQFPDGSTQTTAGNTTSTNTWTAAQNFSSMTISNYLRVKTADIHFGATGAGYPLLSSQLNVYYSGGPTLALWGGATTVTNKISFQATSDFASIVASNFGATQGMTFNAQGPARIFMRDYGTEFTGGIVVSSTMTAQSAVISSSISAGSYKLGTAQDLFHSSMTGVSLAGYGIYVSTARIAASSSLTLTPLTALGAAYSAVVPHSISPINNGFTTNSIEFGAWVAGDTTITLKNNAAATTADVIYSIFVKP